MLRTLLAPVGVLGLLALLGHLPVLRRVGLTPEIQGRLLTDGAVRGGVDVALVGATDSACAAPLVVAQTSERGDFTLPAQHEWRLYREPLLAAYHTYYRWRVCVASAGALRPAYYANVY